MRNVIYIAVFLFFLFPHYIYSSNSSSLRVHFIDVGQGDSMLIETPEDQTILIDGGEPDEGERLVTYLKQHGVTEIDLMIATHPDFDHIGGLLEVMRQFPVHSVLDNGRLHPTKTYATYRLLLFMKSIPVEIAKENKKIQLEKDVKLHFLHAENKQSANPNQSSIVLKLTYDSIDFLFMSDVETEQEKEIMEKYNLDAEVLKVAHHGSDSSSSMAFLEEVNPDASIITYSEGNDYGHPVERVIQYLMKIESQIFSTAGYGDIVVETDGSNYIIMPNMQPVERFLYRLEQ